MKRTVENDEFLRKRKARQKRIRKRRIITGLVFLLVLSIITFVGLSLTVLFPIKALNAKGSKLYTPEQIVAASGINLGDNLFTSGVSIEDIRFKLPYVDEISLERTLPDTLLITVKDAKEYAAYNFENKYYVVSKAGVVLKISDQMPSGLFEIRGVKVKCREGLSVEFKDVKQKTAIEEITALSGEYGININYIDLSDELTLTVKTEGRFIVNLGSSNNLKNKFAHLSGMQKNIEADKTGKINLSMWTSENTEGTFVAGAID